MSVKIRLQRFGSHKKPFYRIVATESCNKRDGKFLEIIGIYHPLSNVISVYNEKLEKWLSFGAQLTKTTKNLLKKNKKNNLTKKC
ncbi:MAG: 30S ribosomal protein S16 [Candidatus Phytoplasma cynodontis]|uniref:30S ribosomal protein S16 n=1 Tax='Cynodon dactylon' phytoplasma TaxID=295320 RepID=UPI001265B277|nr:30S ribosomal protein S16 ['Cynodon dactylon' phytoplasma]KAB8121744.1 30S ribosomal protein S16 ['Cynodon dactylon' phytoplasma]WIA07762.1 MAG: 30S ribosomal protein S16 [Candidatus Phytoplasma cynodontis]